ncbi:hypothetical protein cypCar_00015842 [Cyprinus carpio]|nr:hypothetical protein cypCar_00015842 [Cyprinus carpio]
MPSDFTSLFSADIDLDSPKSLYSKEKPIDVNQYQMQLLNIQPKFYSHLIKYGIVSLQIFSIRMPLAESVYDLLPKELQLPSSREQNAAAMSQKSGGEAGPPPSMALATDASSASSAMSMGSPRRAFPTSASERIAVHESSTPGDVSSRRKAEVLAAENKLSGREKGGQQTQQQHQMTPSKRPVLNISPPPEDLFDESNMSCQDEILLDSEQSSSIWIENSVSNFSIVSSSSYNDNTEVPRKARKCTPRQKPGPKPVPPEEASMDVFDADSAKGPHFVLSQLGPDSKTCSKASSDGPQASGLKGGILSRQYPQKSEGKELKIVVQPETQHRARYLTEGSRGSVKDRTQQGFPTIKLEGVKESVVLQIFVGNDAGRVKPHGFYQACRVTGRNTTVCREVDIEGTTVIEVPLDPSSNMTLAVDCVGILKLRNADVEARIGVAGSKKKSTRARLVFRVNIPRPDGSVLTLQTSSSPILCTQPAGVPEILKKSLHSCSVKGGSEVFIIGKNFLKGTKVIFQESASADDKSWKAEADIDMEFFHQNHLIVKVPPYQNPAITSPVSVGIYVVTNAGRSHDVQTFTYTPEPVIDTALMTPVLPLVKREEVTPMEVSSNPSAFKTPPQLSPIQQGTPMEQQQSPQRAMFQSISQSPSKLPPGQQQQANLLLGSLSSPVTQEQTSNLLFVGQVQIGSMNNNSLASPDQQNTSLPFSQAGMVTVRQQESSEPMTFQDQTTMVVNPSSNKPIFQDQQPMQLAPSSGTAPSQSVNLFMGQSSMQGGMASQETLFGPQSDVTRIQTSTSSPVQQPGQLFQTTMSGSLNQPNQNQQPDLFLFEIQNVTEREDQDTWDDCSYART